MTIKVMSYEECRKEFFVNLIKHAENKIDYWKKQKGNRCEIEEKLSKAGAEISYCQNALKALEKQIPKKPTHEATLYKNLTCPNCKNVIDEFTEFAGIRVRVTVANCKFCGQALDWGEEE